MDPLVLHATLVRVVFGAAIAAAVAVTFITAPYGRHERGGWGPTMPHRAGWVLMESPAVLAFAAFFLTGAHAGETAPRILFALWLLHYVHRTFVFPFRMPAGDKRMPVLVAALAFTFNVINAWVNARWIGDLGSYPTAWLADPRFLLGATLFLGGMAVNVHADDTLLRLRASLPPGQYGRPEGGLYRWISCPNYLGEIVEWFGWALATWSVAGLSFAVFTLANVGPRAFSNHRWMKERFPDYPPDRKALVPFVI